MMCLAIVPAKFFGNGPSFRRAVTENVDRAGYLERTDPGPA